MNLGYIFDADTPSLYLRRSIRVVEEGKDDEMWIEIADSRR